MSLGGYQLGGCGLFFNMAPFIGGGLFVLLLVLCCVVLLWGCGGVGGL